MPHSRPRRPRSRRAGAGALLAAVLIVGLLVPATAPARSPFRTFGSCATKKPFPAATHCGFDRPHHASATVVFRSNVGKRQLKACQKIYGLPFEGHQCLQTKRPTAYEAIPFELKGARNGFKLVVTFFVKPAGGGAYARAGRVALRFG